MELVKRRNLTQHLTTLGVDVGPQHLNRGIIKNKVADRLEKTYPELIFTIIDGAINPNGLGMGLNRSIMLDELPGSSLLLQYQSEQNRALRSALPAETIHVEKKKNRNLSERERKLTIFLNQMGESGRSIFELTILVTRLLNDCFPGEPFQISDIVQPNFNRTHKKTNKIHHTGINFISRMLLNDSSLQDSFLKVEKMLKTEGIIIYKEVMEAFIEPIGRLQSMIQLEEIDVTKISGMINNLRAATKSNFKKEI